MSSEARIRRLRLTEQAEDLAPGITVVRGLVPDGDADRLLTQLLATIPWRQDHIVLFGRRSPVPRLTAWFGDPGHRYTYSGISMDPLPWTPELLELRSLAEAAAGTSFNSVLANQYRDGSDGMGWHADDEPELGPDPVIGSISLGATRRFVLRRRHDRAHRVEVPLGHGDGLVMHGGVQREWEHHVPKTRRPVGARVNLTFRSIVPTPQLS